MEITADHNPQERTVVKILQIIYESFGSPYGFGGAGVRAYEIYKRLSSTHDITLLCMKYPGAKDGVIQGLRHVFLGTENRSLTKSVVAYTAGTSRFIHGHGKEFDVIVENFLPATPFFTKTLTKTPVILQVQGLMEKNVFRKFRFHYSIPMYIAESFYPKLYDRFVFVSEITKDKTLKKIRKPLKLCEVIPNGVDMSLLETVPVEGDYILFFNRIDAYAKGIDILLKAFERILTSYPHVKLICAGHESDKFEGLLKKLGTYVREKITYAGFLSGEEKIRLISGAKIFVLPSRHESFPISILEAAAAQKPVIVSDIAELRHVENNQFGLSFRSGSVEDLQEKLEMLLKSETMRRALGAKGRIFAKNLLWDNLAVKFDEALQASI
jgi:glycosyltransferase involved in cell wall biosynthesis